MYNITPVGTGELYEEVADAIAKSFKADDLDEKNLFHEECSSFLFLDPSYAMQPIDLVNITWPIEGSDLFVGYLRYINNLIVPWSEARTFPSYLLPNEFDVEEATRIFERDPKIKDEGPLLFYVRSGFVLPRGSLRCAMWFSRYWEIAVIAFVKSKDALAFVNSNRSIQFLNRDSVLDIYRDNPRSTAPQLLQRYLAKSALE